MPLPQKWHKKKRPPPGFDYVEPVLEALENELRDKVKDTSEKQRKKEALWPVHQINWQKSRYIYELFYVYKKISKQVYQYCLDQKLVDAALIAKWKKPGYERLCSTYVINPANYKFGTTSICRVPWFDRSEQQKDAKDPTTGCMGCASGKGAGPRNIFGNKYGQSLAAVQMARERRKEHQEKQRQERELQLQQQQQENSDGEESDHDINGDGDERKKTEQQKADDGEAETDDDTDDDDEDFGPSPAAGIWAGSKKLEQESEKIALTNGDGSEAAVDAGDEETDDEDDEGPRPAKKARA